MAKESIVLSIIVPIYNGAKYLDRCVKAIMQEHQIGVELILVDDGSMDNSLSRCERWRSACDYIRVLHHENHGVSYTRNRGIEEAQGSYIWFIDVDDVILSGSIMAILEIVRTHLPDIILFGYRSKLSRKQLNEFDTNPFRAGEYGIEQAIRDLFWDLFRQNLIHNIGNKVYRKEIIKRNDIRFDERIAIYEDAMFCVQAMQVSKRLYVCTNAWYCYNLEENAQSLNHIYRNNYFLGISLLYENIGKLFGKVEEPFYANYLNYVLGAIRNEFRKTSYTYKDFRQFVWKMLQDSNVQKALEMTDINDMVDKKWKKLLNERYFECYLLFGIENIKDRVITLKLANDMFDIAYSIYKKCKVLLLKGESKWKLNL